MAQDLKSTLRAIPLFGDLDADEINQLIKDAMTEISASSMQDMGKVMGILKPKLQGRADMGKVSGLVKQQLD